jgi:iron(III) transport system permease protein
MAAVVFVMTIAGTGNHLLFLGRVVNRVDQNTIEAARMMGASSFTVVRRIVLPTVAPMVYAITVLTFLAGLGALAAPQVLGGEKFQTITPLILSLAGSPGSRDIAAVLSIVLGASTIVLLAVLMRIERRGVYFSISKVPASLQRQRLDSRTGTIAMHVTAYLLFVVYTLPPALIVLFSFTNASAINEARIGVGDLTLENYRRVLTDASAAWPFVVSVGYAATAAVVCVGGLLFVARVLQRHRTTLTTVLEYVLHLPWILPSTMIALGLLVTFDRGQPLVADLVLAGTPALLGVAYVVVKVPFTLRLLKAAYAGVQDNVEEAAAILGASGLTAFRRVVLPLVVPIAAAVAGLTFTSLLDEYDAAAFLHHPLYPPLGIVIRNAAVQDTMTDTTALMFVYTVLLMIVSSIALWLVYGSGARRLGLVGRRRRSVDVER